MYNVTLICTTHKDIGNCNSLELYSIIERLEPQVIFEELSQSAYNHCYVLQDLITLETTAIKFYLQHHTVKHIPVVDNELTKEYDTALNVIITHASYRNLIDDLIFLESTYGFQYLNSKRSDELFEQIKSLEESILQDYVDDVFLRMYQKRYRDVDRYENEIVKNIYKYSKENRYAKALMFIGSAHRKSIIKKLQEYNKKSDLKLNWTFYNT